MNAPEPNLTSITSASSPAASFLDRIEATISGIDSTVPVTSRSAYSRRSAGREVARSGRPCAAGLADDAPQLLERASVVTRDRSPACPASRRCGRDLGPTSSGRRRRRPPRAGPAPGETLSPTPPVECLSTTGPVESQSTPCPSRASPRSARPARRPSIPRRNSAIASAPTCASQSPPSAIPRTRNAISSPRQRRAVALAADDLRREHRHAASASQKRSTSRARSPAASAA